MQLQPPTVKSAESLDVRSSPAEGFSGELYLLVNIQITCCVAVFNCVVVFLLYRENFQFLKVKLKHSSFT